MIFEKINDQKSKLTILNCKLLYIWALYKTAHNNFNSGKVKCPVAGVQHYQLVAANQEEHHHHLHHPQHQGSHLYDPRDVSPIVSTIWNIDVTNNELFIINKI
jgi:hypothetical protein